MAGDKQPCVYILASKRNGTLYVGVTSDVVKRGWEHRNGLVEGFTKKYSIHSLVYYEMHENMLAAITREKQIKKWNRAWKLRLIEQGNPQWRDLWRIFLCLGPQPAAHITNERLVRAHQYVIPKVKCKKVMSFPRKRVSR